MAGSRQVRIGHDADGNIIITGDDNRVYLFPGIKELSTELLAKIERGEVQAHETPDALPLPALELRIESVPAKPEQWQVTPVGHDAEGAARVVPAPWIADRGFALALEGFWELSRRAIEDEAQWEAIHGHARILGEALRRVLIDPEAEQLVAQSRREGPPPFLIIESPEDLILAFPWELLRLEGEYAVQQGGLDVARCVPVANAPELERPTDPVTLLINISAPEGSGLNYEQESYYITRALHDHVGVAVNELGEVQDLIAGVCGESPPQGVHFSGHGGPGELEFEDALGESRTVRVHELLGEIRKAAPERLPRFFYLACCYGGTPPSLGFAAQATAPEAGIPSAAAQLHREGVAQVVAYFGPVIRQPVHTWAEAAFYAEIARGRRTRDALRAARHAMSRPWIAEGREILRDADAGPASGTTPFAWAQLVLYHRGLDWPLGLPIPPRYAERWEALPSRDQESVLVTGRSCILGGAAWGDARRHERARGQGRIGNVRGPRASTAG